MWEISKVGHLCIVCQRTLDGMVEFRSMAGQSIIIMVFWLSVMDVQLVICDLYKNDNLLFLKLAIRNSNKGIDQ